MGAHTTSRRFTCKGWTVLPLLFGGSLGDQLGCFFRVAWVEGPIETVGYASLKDLGGETAKGMEVRR